MLQSKRWSDESKEELLRLTLRHHMVCRKALIALIFRSCPICVELLMYELRLAYICRRRMMRNLGFDRHGCVALADELFCRVE